MQNNAHVQQTHAATHDDPERLADRAIRLLEQHLRTAHGVRAQFGVELEYSILFKPDAPALKPQGSAPKSITQNLVPTPRDPLGLGRTRKGRLFPASRFLGYGYYEAGTTDAIPGYAPAVRQYELVSNHQHPMEAHHLPRAIEALRQELQGHRARAATQRGDAEGNAVERAQHARAQQRDWYEQNVEDIRFDSPARVPQHSGLHLNVSLVDEEGSALLYGGDPLLDQLKKNTQALFAAEKALLVATPSQSMRWEQLCARGVPDVHTRAANPLGTIDTALRAVRHNRPCYLENKAPSADCNPHYAVLLQLAALSNTLDENLSDTPLEVILNTLEPNLGTRFRRAEQAHPEGKSFDHDVGKAKVR